MKASETKIQLILEGTKQYIVPLFQREYTWKEPQWRVLWDDLMWLYDNDEPKTHFVGSVVTMPTNSVPEGIAKYALIDGQQRITTLMILLTAIRDLAQDGDTPDLAREIETNLLVNQFKKGSEHYKILPTQTRGDRTAFIGLIEKTTVKADAKVESGVRPCHQYFTRKLAQHPIDLTTLTHIIIARLSVVSIVLDNDDNPYLVFESLNAKGSKLSQADLLRNYFFMQIPVADQQDVYAEYWQPMQTALNENLTECIRHYLMRGGVNVKQSDVYFTLKDRIKFPAQALGVLQDIARFAGYYARFIDPALDPDADVRRALAHINRLEITTSYPFLLNCYDDYAQGRLPKADLLAILSILENYIVRRFVCNIATSQLNKIFPALYDQAQRELSGDLVGGVRAILQKRNYPKNDLFRAQLENARLYGAGDRIDKTKFILESLEAAYEHHEPVHFEALTIEHIMPQTLSDLWRRDLGEHWQTDYELALHTVGNLTLTGYNSELSNAPFSRKKVFLTNSHLELNQYFQHVETWNRDEIERRSAALAEVALYVWPDFGFDRPVGTSQANPITGQIPVFLTVLGQQFPVKSWRDVAATTLNAIAALEPELFTTLVATYPRFISPTADVFRTQRKLDNDYYLAVNLSAKDIHRFCTQAIETIGLTSEDWIVETRASG